MLDINDLQLTQKSHEKCADKQERCPLVSAPLDEDSMMLFKSIPHLCFIGLFAIQSDMANPAVNDPAIH